MTVFVIVLDTIMTFVIGAGWIVIGAGWMLNARIACFLNRPAGYVVACAALGGSCLCLALWLTVGLVYTQLLPK